MSNMSYQETHKDKFQCICCEFKGISPYYIIRHVLTKKHQKKIKTFKGEALFIKNYKDNKLYPLDIKIEKKTKKSGS